MPAKIVVTIISPKSFSRMDTPFVDYYHRALIAKVGGGESSLFAMTTWQRMPESLKARPWNNGSSENAS